MGTIIRYRYTYKYVCISCSYVMKMYISVIFLTFPFVKMISFSYLENNEMLCVFCYKYYFYLNFLIKSFKNWLVKIMRQLIVIIIQLLWFQKIQYSLWYYLISIDAVMFLCSVHKLSNSGFLSNHKKFSRLMKICFLLLQ